MIPKQLMDQEQKLMPEVNKIKCMVISDKPKGKTFLVQEPWYIDLDPSLD